MLPDPNLANNNCHHLLAFLSCVIVIKNYSDCHAFCKATCRNVDFTVNKTDFQTFKRMACDQIGNKQLCRDLNSR